MVGGDHDGRVSGGASLLIGIGERHDPIELKSQSCEFACLSQRLCCPHTTFKTFASLLIVGNEHIIQPAGRILNDGMVNAIAFVGRIGLLAGTYASDGGLRHRRTGQGGHHEFASFSHTVNTNTSKNMEEAKRRRFTGKQSKKTKIIRLPINDGHVNLPQWSA